MVGLGAAFPRAGVGLPVLGCVCLLFLLRGFSGGDAVGVLDGRIGGRGFGRCLRAVRGLLLGGVFHECFLPLRRAWFPLPLRKRA